MRQALHIFKKDVRGLVYEIVVTLLLVVVFAAADSRPYFVDTPTHSTPGHPWTGFLWIFLPMSWWVLTAKVVQAEAIPGDRQFWLTRPYSWKSLLASKIAFLMVFISVPMMISDVIILRGEGFPVASNAVGIFWEMLLRLDVFVLSAMALASLTRGLAGFMITGLLAGIAAMFDFGFVSGRGIDGWSGYGWTLIATGAALAPAAILLQYARRKKVALTLVICALLLPVVGFRFEWAFRAPDTAMEASAGGPALQFELDSHSVRSFVSRAELKPLEVLVALPIEIVGIPDGLRATSKSAFVTLSSTSGEWTGGVSESGMVSPDRSLPDARFYWMEIKVPRDFYDQVTREKLAWDVHASADLVLYRNLRSTAVGESEVTVPGVGYCSTEWRLLRCRSALRHPSISIKVYDSAGSLMPDLPFNAERSPFPAELGISPIVYTAAPFNVTEVELVTGEPVFHLRRVFDLSPIRLEDYVVK
jgi:hypothetical protein